MIGGDRPVHDAEPVEVRHAVGERGQDPGRLGQRRSADRHEGVGANPSGHDGRITARVDRGDELDDAGMARRLEYPSFPLDPLAPRQG